MRTDLALAADLHIEARPRVMVDREAETIAGGQRLINAFFKAVPVLWLGGALSPAGALILLYLFWTRWPRGILISMVAGSWIVIGLAQALAALVTASILGYGLVGSVGRTISLATIGWMLGGIAIAVGYSYRLAGPSTVRAITWMGLSILILAAVAAVLAAAGVSDATVRAPLGLLLPDGATATFYFSISLYKFEESFGDAATRLILFFPWPTALSMGSIAIAAISLRDESRFWRLAGFAGGLTGVICSWSRIGFAAFVLMLACEIWFRCGRLARATMIALPCTVLLLVLLSGTDPIQELVNARQSVDSARAGSSEARELIYERSWEGFLESPWFGHGWIGPSVHPIEELPIGSHSSIYGLAYTGGVVTLGAFLAMLALTLGATFACASSNDRRGTGRTAFALALTLAVFSPYEVLFSFTLPCLFLFTWIGGALAIAIEDPDPTPSSSATAHTARPDRSSDRELTVRKGSK